MVGPGGSGKTAEAMTLGADLELICTDMYGWKVCRSLKDKHYDARNAVEVTECYEDVGNPGTGYSKVRTRMFAIQREINAKTYKRRAVCIDSLTSLGEQSMRLVLSTAGKMENGVVRTTPKGTGIEIQHWGTAMQQVEDIVVLLRTLPMLCILTAHSGSEEVDGMTKKILSVIGSKLGPKIPPFFDEYWYFNASAGAGGTVDYKIQTKMSSSVEAKTRDGLPDGTLASEGMPSILKRMGYDWSAT